MSFRTLKKRKLNRVISFMLMLVMVATMLPLFSMPEVHAAEPVKQVTLFSTGLTSSDSTLCNISKNSNVTWNSSEKCAVFSGSTSYLKLTNPFRNVSANTGISIKMDAYIYSDTTGFSRLFEIGDGTTNNNLLLNAGTGNGNNAHLAYYTYVGGSSTRTTQSKSYFNGWHTYEVIFYPGGTNKLFVDGEYVSGYSDSPVNSLYTNMLNKVSSWNSFLIGTSIWQLSGATKTDGYLHGKIRNLTITSGAVYHVDIDNNGRGSSTYDRQYVSLGGMVDKPADPVASGNVFANWVDSATSSHEYDFSKSPTADTKIYARWHQYKIEAKDNQLLATCTGDTASDCTYRTTPLVASINVDDVLYSPRKSAVNPSVTGRTQFSNITKLSVSDVVYYVDSALNTKTNLANAGAASEGGTPSKIGTYYAVISAADKKAVSKFAITTVEDNSNFTTDSLNNLVKNKSSEGVAKKVSGDNPSATLKVILLNESDNVDLYKIADIAWDSTNSAYTEVTWVDYVEEWLSDSAYSDMDVAANPLLISDMSSTLESEFFGNLLSKDDGALKDKEPTIANAAASIKKAAGEDGTYYTSFSNVPAGMYAVISEDNYSPVVISILPYQNGPGAAWYLDSEYIARLKSSAVDVNKKINSKDISDTVAYKDTVTFDIDFKFPSFKTDYADRVTIKEGSTDASLDYKLYAVDTMSPAFELINTEANKPTIKYTIGDGEATEFPESVDYEELADDDTTVSKSAPVYTIGEPVVNEDGTTTLNITFNVHALKAFTKSLDMNKFVMTLHYQATVTDKAEIGSDKNTNVIVLDYETTPGKTSKTEDTVYGYTYGLQVIKIDGTESTEEANKYLAGAKFKLYKEVEEKPDDMTNVYTYEDEAKRYFVPVTDIFTGTTSGVDENGVFTSVADENGIVIKGLKEGKYILVETKAPFGYNELAEDIYFEINKLTDEEVSSRYGGRYKIFKEMSIPDQDTVYNESGMISLSVLNYRGLTLPSTGGIGILIFTIIGIVMMMAAIIVLVIRRRTQSSVDYM